MFKNQGPTYELDVMDVMGNYPEQPADQIRGMDASGKEIWIDAITLRPVDRKPSAFKKAMEKL